MTSTTFGNANVATPGTAAPFTAFYPYAPQNHDYDAALVRIANKTSLAGDAQLKTTYEAYGADASSQYTTFAAVSNPSPDVQAWLRAYYRFISHAITLGLVSAPTGALATAVAAITIGSNA